MKTKINTQVFKTANGRWAFCIYRDGVEIASGSGFADRHQAKAMMTKAMVAIVEL